jgi:hypothetical protein
MSQGVFAVSSADVCEDLAQYTCSSGKHFDGTGTVERTPVEETSNEAILSRNKDLLQKTLHSFLKSSLGQELRRNSLRALGITRDEDLEKVLLPLVQEALGGAKVEGKKRALSISSSLFSQKAFKKLVEDLRHGLSARLTDPKKKLLLSEKIFPGIKQALLRRIQRLPLEASQRQRMVHKVMNVRLDSETTCDAGGVPLLYRATARYDSEFNSLRVCDGALSKNASEFKLVHSVAHEIAHSVDPCHIAEDSVPGALQYSTYSNREVMESEYPVRGLLACLRSESSIGATGRPADSPVESADFKSTAVVYDFCENDQINEAVADWFSNEVLTEFLAQSHPALGPSQWREGFSNIFRLNCNDTTSSEDVHPSIQSRLNRLLLVQPQVRKQLGCFQPSAFKYCEVPGI